MKKLDGPLLLMLLRLYEDFLKKKSADPTVQVETGRAYFRVGDINRLLGHKADAEKSYLKAIALLEPLAKQFPDVPEYRHAAL